MFHNAGFAIALAAGGLAWAISVTYLGFTADPRTQFSGLEHLSVFQRVKPSNDYSRRTAQEVDEVSASATPSNSSTPARKPTVSASPFDMAATASISDPRVKIETQAKLDTPVPDHTLLSVTGDRALVQASGILKSVTQGDNLGVAGTVLSIQRRGGDWVVITESGTIRSHRSR